MIRIRIVHFPLFTLLVVPACTPPATSEPATPSMPTAVLEEGAGLQTATSVVFTEGPAADAEGNVYFSEITGNRILKYSPGASWEVFRQPSRRSNGLAFDAQGRLIACEGAADGGGRQVTRTDLTTGEIEVLAQAFEGRRLNSPNDLVIDSRGRIYFSDPRYGDQAGRELETEDVYLIDLDGSLKRVLTAPDIYRPNGLGISPDGGTLYVADTAPGPPREARLMRFELSEEGIPSNGSRLYSFGEGRGIDGMAVDVEGNIFGAAGNNSGPPENHAGIYVISPSGSLIGRIPIPEDSVTNCTFGGEGLRTLYITAGKNLFQIRTRNRGHLVYPALP